MTLTNVTVSGNTTGNNPGNGGGLHITGAGTLVVNTSTFSGNTAANEGGGLWNSGPGSMTLNQSTVSGTHTGTLDGPTGATIYHAAVARPRSLLIRYPDHEGKPILCEGAVYAFRNIEAKVTPGRATWIKDAERTAWPAWMSGMIVPPEPAK